MVELATYKIRLINYKILLYKSYTMMYFIVIIFVNIFSWYRVIRSPDF